MILKKLLQIAVVFASSDSKFLFDSRKGRGEARKAGAGAGAIRYAGAAVISQMIDGVSTLTGSS
jgi:hypothetical protein